MKMLYQLNSNENIYKSTIQVPRLPTNTNAKPLFNINPLSLSLRGLGFFTSTIILLCPTRRTI